MDMDDADGDDTGAPSSNEGEVPRWLKIIYFSLPLWGLIWFYFFWNGSGGWFDRGAWQNLQQAANTTHPVLDLTQDRTKKYP